MMPGIEGPELCSRARELDHGKLLHLILLTARESREDLVKGLAAGANDYVTKPFDRDELKARFEVGLRVIELQETLIKAERYRVLTQAAGAAAHEINQPLTALLGTADLMLMELPEDDPNRESFETLQKAGERIRVIVKKMQTLRDIVTRPYPISRVWRSSTSMQAVRRKFAGYRYCLKSRFRNLGPAPSPYRLPVVQKPARRRSRNNPLRSS